MRDDSWKRTRRHEMEINRKEWLCATGKMLTLRDQDSMSAKVRRVKFVDFEI